MSCGQGLEPPVEAVLDAARQRLRVGKPEAARQLRRRQPPRQLEQRERIAAGLGDDAVAHLLVQPSPHGGRQQLPRVGVADAVDRQLRQAAERLLVAGLANGE